MAFQTNPGTFLQHFGQFSAERMSLFCFILFMVLISSPSAASEHMAAQAIMMTNSKYAISERLGTVLFTQDDYGGPVRITGELTFKNLESGHVGMHVHAFGNLSRGCESTGPHFNPTRKQHGSPSDENRHVGDLGNIEIINYKSTIDIKDNQVQLVGPHSILGRSLVIHMSKDDLGKGGNEESFITGNVGRFLGCGIIGVTNDFSFNAPVPASTEKSVSSTHRHLCDFALSISTVILLILRNFPIIFP